MHSVLTAFKTMRVLSVQSYNNFEFVAIVRLVNDYVNEELSIGLSNKYILLSVSLDVYRST